jgi:sporulation protein YlmC with PRC-barrel domain
MCEGSKVLAEDPATEDIMTHSRSRKLSLTFAFFVLCLAASPAVAQEIGLIAADTKEVAKGYRASALQLKNVVNDKGERIGRIDDFIFGADEGVFAVLAVGEFVGPTDHLVAVPFRSLKLDGRGGDIVLPGASRAALAKLPVFLYSR